MGCPVLLRVPLACCQHARVPPLRPGAHDALLPQPVRETLQQPCGGDGLKAPTAVRGQPPGDGALLAAPRHGLQGIMRAATGAQSLGEAAPLLRLESVPYHHRGPLDALICQGREAAGALAALRLRALHPLDRAGMVPPALEAG